MGPQHQELWQQPGAWLSVASTPVDGTAVSLTGEGSYIFHPTAPWQGDFRLRVTLKAGAAPVGTSFFFGVTHQEPFFLLPPNGLWAQLDFVEGNDIVGTVEAASPDHPGVVQGAQKVPGALSQTVELIRRDGELKLLLVGMVDAPTTLAVLKTTFPAPVSQLGFVLGVKSGGPIVLMETFLQVCLGHDTPLCPTGGCDPTDLACQFTICNPFAGCEPRPMVNNTACSAPGDAPKPGTCQSGMCVASD